jgi:hypothetical protein
LEKSRFFPEMRRVCSLFIISLFLYYIFGVVPVVSCNYKHSISFPHKHFHKHFDLLLEFSFDTHIMSDFVFTFFSMVQNVWIFKNSSHQKEQSPANFATSFDTPCRSFTSKVNLKSHKYNLVVLKRGLLSILTRKHLLRLINV